MREQDIKHSTDPFNSLYQTGFKLKQIRSLFPLACRKMGVAEFKPMGMDEIMELDRIVLDGDITDVCIETGHKLEGMGVPLSANWFPFLEEGVIVFNDKGVTTYVCWISSKGQAYVEVYSVEKHYTQGKPELSYRMTLNDYGNSSLEQRYDSREHIILDAVRAGKISVDSKDAEMIESAVNQIHEMSKSMATSFMSLFRIINSMLEADDKESHGTKKPYSTVLRANKKKGLATRIVYLDHITVTPGKNSRIKIHRGGIMNRHTDVWGVRGHERHYKSGRVIWIAPYEKGPERGNKRRDPKEYRLGGAHDCVTQFCEMIAAKMDGGAHE